MPARPSPHARRDSMCREVNTNVRKGEAMRTEKRLNTTGGWRMIAKRPVNSAVTTRWAALLGGILLMVIVCPQLLFAQTLADSVKWRIYLSGVDSGDVSVKPVCVIGLHPDAHNPIPPTDTMRDFGDRWWEDFVTRIGSDSEWSQAPPAPPGSYWQLANLRQPYVLQYKMMYHHFVDTTMSDTTVVKWASQTIAAQDIYNQTWSWPSPKVLKYYADSILLTDATGLRLRINLLKDSLYNYNTLKDTVPGSGGFPISTSNMRLIIFHPKRAPLPPDTVGIIYPVNGATNLNSRDTLQWVAVPTFGGFIPYYRVQIANDRTFKTQSIVMQDSITGTSRRFDVRTVGWYYWRVKAFTPFGVGIDRATPDSFLVTVVNGVAGGDGQQKPMKFALYQSYPNPFNPSTAISYSLPVRSFVRLTVYNTLGSPVRILQNGYQEAGYKSVVFDAKDLPSGIYFYQLQAGTFKQTNKMILLK